MTMERRTLISRVSSWTVKARWQIVLVGLAMLSIAAMLAFVRPLPAAVQGGATAVVSVKFLNNTHDIRTLRITTPAGKHMIGTFSSGGKLSATIPVANRDVPVTVRWRAGNQSGTFIVDGDTAPFLRIELTPRGPVGPNEDDNP